MDFMGKIIVFLIFLFLSGCYYFKSYDEIVNEGFEFLDKGDIVPAKKNFEFVLSQINGHDGAKLGVGTIQFNEESYSDARKTIDDCLSKGCRDLEAKIYQKQLKVLGEEEFRLEKENYLLQNVKLFFDVSGLTPDEKLCRVLEVHSVLHSWGQIKSDSQILYFLSNHVNKLGGPIEYPSPEQVKGGLYYVPYFVDHEFVDNLSKNTDVSAREKCEKIQVEFKKVKKEILEQPMIDVYKVDEETLKGNYYWYVLRKLVNSVYVWRPLETSGNEGENSTKEQLGTVDTRM